MIFCWCWNIRIQLVIENIGKIPYSIILLRTALSNTHRILDICFTENPLSNKLSIKILGITNYLVLTTLCEVHKPKVEHSILRNMIALRSVNLSLRKSSVDTNMTQYQLVSFAQGILLCDQIGPTFLGRSPSCHLSYSFMCNNIFVHVQRSLSVYE